MKFPSVLTGRFLVYLIALLPMHLLAAGEQATAVATVTEGYVTGIKVITGGSGYQSEPRVSFSGGGGSGAVAKAILSGDKVGQIIVLNAGSGYSAAPVVAIEAPPRETSLTIELVPKITVWGQSGSPHRVEWSATPGPGEMWQVLTNVTVGTDGVTVVDLAVGSATRFYRAVTVAVTVPSAPSGMVLIPAGSFEMGDTFNEGNPDERPVHSVFISGFYMDKTEVTKALWDEVKGWSTGYGYGFDNPGEGKAANHPVHTVNWFDVVKWCNARSELAGKTPVYYTDVGLTRVYRTGEVPVFVNWGAKGYRLPTEAEWEKAARGGLSGQRFPWGNLISQGMANYYGTGIVSYDVGSDGYNPIGKIGGTTPATSPVGSFAANGYGLYDMVGNVWEWCWDWVGSYSLGSQTDSRGPDSGSSRVIRGGSWGRIAYSCRSAYRSDNRAPVGKSNGDGFRSVLPTGQP
ncbi:MAG: formylglycine-generating enzyme family protein [Pedosphaera sp.]|nr:formylglycine-generating enzyme family protein [Pedosphaera sp.]